MGGLASVGGRGGTCCVTPTVAAESGWLLGSRSEDRAQHSRPKASFGDAVHAGDAAQHAPDIPRLQSWLWGRSEEHTSELQSRPHLVCRLLLEKKKNNLGDRV